MHTTGFAAEPMAGLYEARSLSVALQDARARTLGLYGHLDLPRLRVPCIPIVNPPLWELSHIAWFQEHWCLRWDAAAGEAARPSRLARADEMFNSARIPHDERWTQGYPPPEALLGYMRATLDATLAALAAPGHADPYFFRLALFHEDMHAEALLMTLQSLGLPEPAVAASMPPSGAAPSRTDVAFPAGSFQQGTAAGGAHFVFDNEQWSHRREVAAFAMGSTPVTQGEFLAFVEDGGYRRRELWSGEGWSWRESVAAECPVYWRREAGQWCLRRFDRWLAIDASAPMVHVNRHEAMSYCAWAGRRLPTETEWEYAARNAGRADRYPWGDERRNGANLDLRQIAASLAAEEPAPSRSGVRHLIGAVWEWTASAFEPYPGFEPGPYQEYSQPWFHTHAVLRGGSHATRSRLVHNGFRNFYLPDRRDVFAGFRTCAVETG